MALPYSLLLLLSAFTGLVVGRRRAVVPAAAAVIPCGVLGGPVTAGSGAAGHGGPDGRRAPEPRGRGQLNR